MAEPVRSVPWFSETQRFRNPVLWIAMAMAFVPLFVILGIGLWTQLVEGRPFGNEPLGDGGLIAITALVLLIAAGVVWLFVTASLVTEVGEDGVRVRFRPFHRATRRIDGIVSAQARRYGPLREYGGWGIRYGWGGGMAYNVSGDRGVQLEIREGKRLLIGSQRPEELEAAIRRYLARPSTTGV